jgi:hypothetical protein
MGPRNLDTRRNTKEPEGDPLHAECDQQHGHNQETEGHYEDQRGELHFALSHTLVHVGFSTRLRKL